MSGDGAEFPCDALMPIPNAISTGLPESDGIQDLFPKGCRELRSERVIPSSVEVIHVHDGCIFNTWRKCFSERALSAPCSAIYGDDAYITDERWGARSMLDDER